MTPQALAETMKNLAVGIPAAACVLAAFLALAWAWVNHPGWLFGLVMAAGFVFASWGLGYSLRERRKQKHAEGGKQAW